jgi:MFS transporter, PAT family, beta-lactamase induction signal transducer AmpG
MENSFSAGRRTATFSSAPAPRTRLILTENRPLRFVAFFYLYAMQGVPAGFATTALANYLAAEGLRSDQIGTFVAMQGLPWGFQFVWGPFLDKFQGSRLGRRRPWVVAAQFAAFLASLSMLFVSDPASSVTFLGIAFFIHSTIASVQDASVDAMAISTIPERERGRINAFMRGGFLVGTALGAAGLAWVLRNAGFHTAVLTQSAFLLALTVVTFFIRERATDALLPGQVVPPAAAVAQRTHNHSIGWLFRELFRGLAARESLRWFVPILLVFSCQNAFKRAFDIHLIQVVGWRDVDLSALTGSYGIGIVIGIVLLGGWLADRVGARRLLPFVVLIHFTYLLSINLLASYWSNPAFASVGVVLWSVMDPSLSIAAIPILMSLCRPDVEGSQFTTYMALVNLSDVLGAFVSGHAQQYVSASTIGLCAATVVGLVLLWLLTANRSRLHKTI